MMRAVDMAAKQAIQAAWQQYTEVTEGARDRFDTAIRAAITERDTTYAHLRAVHELGNDDAFHAYNERYSEAWADYEQATREARLVRDDLIDQATPRAITRTAEQWPAPDTSELPRFVPGDIQP